MISLPGICSDWSMHKWGCESGKWRSELGRWRCNPICASTIRCRCLARYGFLTLSPDFSGFPCKGHRYSVIGVVIQPHFFSHYLIKQLGWTNSNQWGNSKKAIWLTLTSKAWGEERMCVFWFELHILLVVVLQWCVGICSTWYRGNSNQSEQSRDYMVR